MVRRRQLASLLAGLVLAGTLWLIAYGLPAVDRALVTADGFVTPVGGSR